MWFDWLCNGLKKFRHVLYFLRNKQVVPVFELCMGRLESCCAKLSVYHNFFTLAICKAGGFRHLFFLKLSKKLKLMPKFLWPCMAAFRHVAWNGTDRTDYGLEEKLRFPKKRTDELKLTCKRLYLTGNWEFLEKLAVAALAICYVTRSFITIITTASH